MWLRGRSSDGVTINGVNAEIGGRFHYKESDLEWSLELASGKSSQRFSVLGINATITDDYLALPWLNLRYYIPNEAFPDALDSVRPFVSATMGGTLLKRNLSVTGLVTGSKSLDNAYLLSFGPGVGVVFNVTKKLTIEASYRYLLHAEMDFNPFNDLGIDTSGNLDSWSPVKNYPNTGIVSVGLSFSF